jgi:hypothetical protein
LECPCFTLRSKSAVVSGSCAMRTMTMRKCALLAWRSPPRSSRCRLLLPDEAGMGAATPHRWAPAAFE